MEQQPSKSEPPALSYVEVLYEEDLALRGSPDTAIEALREQWQRAADGADREAAERNFRNAVYARLHRHQRSALCFSGGGIRSATFGLGILQGLAAYSRPNKDGRPQLLGEFDYLSTVSGGGYLGSWFSAWAARAEQDDNPRVRSCTGPGVKDGPGIVMSQLARTPDSTFGPEPLPVKHLREYTNYLSPRIGLLSADTWALSATVVRNIVLNWLVLTPLLLAALFIPVLAQRLIQIDPVQASANTLRFLLISASLCVVLATAYVGCDLPSIGNRRRSTTWFLYFNLLPISIAAVHFSVFWAWLPAGNPDVPAWDVIARGRSGLGWLHFLLLGAAIHGGGLLLGALYVKLRYGRPPAAKILFSVLAAVATGIAAGAVACLLARVPDFGNGHLLHHSAYVVLGFPAVMGVFLLAGMLLVGLTSYVTEDEDREWWSRAGGWYLAVAAGWLVFSSIVLYAGAVFHLMTMQLSAALTGATGLTGWMVSRLGASARTVPRSEQDAGSSSPPVGKGLVQELAARLLLPVFLVLLAMSMAIANGALLRFAYQWFPILPSPWPRFLKLPGEATGHEWLVVLFYLAFCLLWSSFINVNKFSLHGMYRERLIRAYLAASNRNRHPHLFTGFDENDNLPLCALSPRRPLHLINMALNLVHGSNLAWQERKAESFSASRLHTGSCQVGYRPSFGYGGHYNRSQNRTPITLGTAMTISGAAASPNMGYHSSPLLTITMSLFNARLGWWLGNPRSKSSVWRRPGPTIGLLPFVEETFGLTDDDNNWIYLSDGGHFENLGLYEMVLRRCHLIFVSDASADPLFHFDDLANAIRKIRIDLGIPITFERPSLPMSPSGKADNDYPGHHCAVGKIHYDAVDPEAPVGTLIYVKASLNGNEPADVKQYRAANPSFPHQSTVDQFFNEGQFESYRRLGLHVVEEVCNTGLQNRPTFDLLQFRDCVLDYARAPLAHSGPVAPRDEDIYFQDPHKLSAVLHSATKTPEESPR